MVHKRIDIHVDGSQDYAALYTYFIDNSPELRISMRPLVLICPGGGYGATSDREAEPIALQFNAKGYHAGVLRYSTAPSTYSTQLLELGKAIVIIRDIAEEFNIDAERIVLLGFSAGGHLVANYCAAWQGKLITEGLNIGKERLRPNAMMLGYPVITSGEFAHRGSFENLLGAKYVELRDEVSIEKLVSDSFPRSFIWHTLGDSAVPVQNSLMLVNELVKQGISTEYHMFERGAHGLALSNELTASPSGLGIESTCECWIEMAYRWLANL